MIHERIVSATIRSIGYDPADLSVIVGFADGRLMRHVPVPYSVYRSIVSSRFPEKIYRHLVAERVLPAATMGSE